MLSPSVREGVKLGVGGGRATFSILSGPGIAALFAILAAISGGVYMYQNWGKPSVEPVQPGPAMTNRDDSRLPLGPWKGSQNQISSDPYGVFIGGPYNEVIVGQLSVIMEATTPSLVGWGQDYSKRGELTIY